LTKRGRGVPVSQGKERKEETGKTGNEEPQVGLRATWEMFYDKIGRGTDGCPGRARG